VPNQIQIQKIIGIWTIVISIITAVGSATVYVCAQVRNIAQQEINIHDHGYPTPSSTKHPELTQKIEELNIKIKTGASCQEDLTEAYWYLVGYIQADYESNPRLKAAAASYYRGVFREQLMTCNDISKCRPDGKPYIRDAFRATINYPWPERNLLVRQLR